MTPAEFSQQFMPYAQRVSQRTGLDPRLVLAQAALETGYGRSAPNNNYFGIKSHGKSGGSNLMTKEFEGGRMVSKPQSFRGYADPSQSFEGYADFILSNPRYKKVLGQSGLSNQIAAMGESGYATDPKYASKLRSIANRFGADMPTQPIQPATVSTQGTASMMQQEEETPRGLLGGLGIQKMQEGAPGETGQRFYERDSFKDTAALLAQGFGRMGIMGMEEIADGIAKQRTEAKAKNKTMEALSKMNTPQAKAAVEYINAGGDAVSALKMAFTPAKDDSTALMKNYEFFVSQGMGPEDAMKAVRSGTTINMGDVGQGDYLYGSKAGLQPGYRLNVKTGEASPIPGGPADTAAKEAEAADAGASTQATAGSTVLGDITEMKRRVQESPTLTTGFIGGILKKVGGTGALDVDELGKTIRANIGFDRLQRMRDESPTGGALGQVAVQELEALQASLGSLNTSQGPDQLIRNLERLETQYRRSMQRILNTEGGAKYFTQGEADLIQNAQQGSSQTKTGITYKVLD